MIDTLGRTIHVGDLITYPVRHRSDLWVNAGKVLSVGDDGMRVLKYEDGECRVVVIRNSRNVTIVERGVASEDSLCIADTLLGVTNEVPCTPGIIAQ